MLGWTFIVVGAFLVSVWFGTRRMMIEKGVWRSDGGAGAYLWLIIYLAMLGYGIQAVGERDERAVINKEGQDLVGHKVLEILNRQPPSIRARYELAIQGLASEYDGKGFMPYREFVTAARKSGVSEKDCAELLRYIEKIGREYR